MVYRYHVVFVSLLFCRYDTGYSNFPGVSDIHDLHIWGMSTTDVALTTHLVKQSPKNDDQIVAVMKNELKKRFGIGHITFQWERGDELHPDEDPCENNQ